MDRLHADLIAYCVIIAFLAVAVLTAIREAWVLRGRARIPIVVAAFAATALYGACIATAALVIFLASPSLYLRKVVYLREGIMAGFALSGIVYARWYLGSRRR